MILEDLKNAVGDIALDATEMHDEILVSLDHIIKASPDLESNPEIKAAIDSLKASHVSFVENVKVLKDKVDSVVASGGPST